MLAGAACCSPGAFPALPLPTLPSRGRRFTKQYAFSSRFLPLRPEATTATTPLGPAIPKYSGGHATQHRWVTRAVMYRCVPTTPRHMRRAVSQCLARRTQPCLRAPRSQGMLLRPEPVRQRCSAACPQNGTLRCVEVFTICASHQNHCCVTSKPWKQPGLVRGSEGQHAVGALSFGRTEKNAEYAGGNPARVTMTISTMRGHSAAVRPAPPRPVGRTDRARPGGVQLLQGTWAPVRGTS
jgi:hypothetical protein